MLIKLFYIRIMASVFSVAVVFNFIRLFSDMYGAVVTALLQIILVKQMYNFFTGRDMSFSGTYAGREFAFEVRLLVFVIFFLIYLFLFFV